MQLVIPQIPKEETKRYATTQWTYNGIAVTLDDPAIQFATDWANLLLSQAIPQFLQVLQSIPPPAQEVPTSEEKPKTLIVEG